MTQINKLLKKNVGQKKDEIIKQMTPAKMAKRLKPSNKTARVRL